MKKIIAIILVLWSAVASAQPSTYTKINNRYNWLAIGTDAFNMPAMGTPAFRSGQWVRAGAMVYDSTGGNRGVHVWTGSAWVKLYDTLMSVGGTLTPLGSGYQIGVAGTNNTKSITATNGLTPDSATSGQVGLKLGGAITGPTLLPISSNPIQITHSAVDTTNVTDSMGLILRNTAAAPATTSAYVSPSLQFVTSGRKTSGGAAATPIIFRLDAYGRLGNPNGSGILRLSSRANGVYFPSIFTIDHDGSVSALEYNGMNTGYPGRVHGGTAWVTSLSNSFRDATSSSGGNVAFGTNMFDSLTDGSDNVAVGSGIFQVLKTGNFNTAMGVNTLRINTASYNTAFGFYALNQNTTGEQNSAFGTNTLTANTTGLKNTAMGTAAMENTTTGSFNSALGHDAMLQNTTGTDNIGVGWLGWSQNRTGSYNIGIGNSTGRSITDGKGNIYIGHEAGYLDFGGSNAGQNDTIAYSIGLGANVLIDESYKMVLGNDSLAKTHIYGIASGSGPKVLTYDESTKQVFYTDTAGLGGGGGSTAWDAITNPGGAQSLTFGDAETNTWTNQSNTETFLTVTNNSQTTGKSFDISSSSLTSGRLMDLVVTGTGAAGDFGTTTSQTGLRVSLSGANSTSSVSSFGGTFSNAHTGTGNINVGVYAEATGSGSSGDNYAGYFTSSSNSYNNVAGFFQSTGSGGNNYGIRVSASGGAENVAIEATGLIIPTSTGASTLGSTSRQFADLFLDEGSVINWDNGDATLTQAGNVVTLAGADLTVPNVTVSSLTSGRVPIVSTSGLIADNDGLTFAPTTNTLNILGPATSLTTMPKLSLGFDSDADAVQSAFAYNHDNTAWMFDTWYNGSNFVSSHAGSNFALYKTGNELSIAYNAGTSKASTFASFNTTSGVRFSSTGRLGIGTAPAVQLHTTGAVRFANFGAGTATFDASGNISSVSDGRLKNIVGDYRAGLKEVLMLNPIRYTWKEMSGMETAHEYAGLDAREVYSVLGDLGSGQNNEGYRSVQDRALIAALINSVKELNARIVELEKKVKK